MNYQILSTDKVREIKSIWKTNGGQNGYWKPQQSGGLEYITQVIIDTIRLLYDSEIIQELYPDDSVTPNRIANDFAKVPEDLPAITVNVNDSNTGIRSLGIGITNDALNMEREESWEASIIISIVGRDKRECDLMTDRFSSAFINFIVPALHKLNILTMAKYNISASRERIESTNFKPIERTMSFRVKYDYVPNEFVITDPLLSEVVVDPSSE